MRTLTATVIGLLTLPALAAAQGSDWPKFLGPLGTSEVCLRQFARKLRALAPVARERRAPPPGWSHSA